MIIYEGPSLLDGEPIVVVAAMSKRNPKTGPTLQTWIMRQDVAPHSALKTGADKSVCGDCKFRPINAKTNPDGGICYVRVHQPVLSVWGAYHRSRYPVAPGMDAIAAHGAGKVVRLGAYGDPAAVPVEVWRALVSRAAAWTGYTHQWRDPRAAGLKDLCMASTEDAEGLALAREQGWRSFRVRGSTEALAPREITCPASKEAGERTTCAECRACGGQSAKARVDIAIVAHGAMARRFLVTRNAA